MNLLILNGPNLNLTGSREPQIYGTQSFNEYLVAMRKKFSQVEIDYLQDNEEGKLVKILHEAKADGIVFNPGAFSHYSLALADALAAISVPVIEVHLSNLYARDLQRNFSLTGSRCKSIIMGFGMLSYDLAIEAFLKMAPAR